jgi:hypothetical protein
VANDEHLALLRQGTAVWNKWRLRNRDIRPNLSGANLTKADFSKADLSKADLSEADLSEADLSEADLSETDLSEADLSETDLSEADLSEADLSEADLVSDKIWWRSRSISCTTTSSSAEQPVVPDIVKIGSQVKVGKSGTAG